MITTNIDVSDGLFNGATGIIRFIEQSLQGAPMAIWIEFDDSTIGKAARTDRRSIQESFAIPKCNGYESQTSLQTNKKGSSSNM